MLARRHLVVVLVLALATARTGAGKETPAADGWDSTEGAPAWVETLPASPDAIRVVGGAQSNLLDLADGFHAGYVKRQVGNAILWRLRPVLGEGADAVLGALPEQPTLVRKAYHLTSARRGDNFPGAACYTVWALWEVPAAPVLDRVPEGKRDEARRALASAEPAGTPAWAKADAPPSWVAKPPPTDGHLSVVLAFQPDRVDVARAEAAALGPSRVASDVMVRLRTLLGPEEAWRVGDAAATWRRCVARAFATGDDERVRAWEHWVVPLDRILAAVPEARRKAARGILAPPPPPK